ncbi:hypothetical protein COOONC_02858 [Cooperia oncophora]
MNFLEKPKNVDVLLNTKFIQGRLVITNNKGLGSFHYLRNVEEIGTPDVGELDMPNLNRVVQNENDEIRVRIRHNKILLLTEEEVSSLKKAAGGEEHTDLNEHHLRRNRKKKTELTILEALFIIFVILLLVLVLLLLMLIKNRMRPSSGLPRPPFRISKKSQAILLDMSKTVMTFKCLGLLERSMVSGTI